MTWIKKYKWQLLIAFLAIPVLINFLVAYETPFGLGIAGKPSDWIIFWATYLGAFASFAMVFMTWQSLKQNQAQLEEMKRQFEAEREPHIIISFCVSRKAYFLKVTNIGLYPAYNIRFNFNQEFFDSLPDVIAKDCVSKVTEPFFVEGRGTKHVLLGWCKDIDEKLAGKDIVIKVDGTYCENKEIHTSYHIDEIIGKRFARVVDDLTFAVEGLEDSISSANSVDKYPTIQKSLSRIAKLLENQSKTSENNAETRTNMDR